MEICAALSVLAPLFLPTQASGRSASFGLGYIAARLRRLLCAMLVRSRYDRQLPRQTADGNGSGIGPGGIAL